MEYWSDGLNLGEDGEPVLSESRRIDFSRASHLDLFEQPGIRVFNSLHNVDNRANVYASYNFSSQSGIPSVPLFQRRKFRSRTLIPSLKKRGRGDFLERRA
jgi:hypothetical protein